MSRAQIQAVVFDLDGLLVDSEPVQIEAWDAFLAQYGHALDPALLGDMFGLRVWDSARLVRDRLALPLSVDEVVAQRDAIFFDLLPGRLQPMPGTVELVTALTQRGLPLGLATSGHRRYVDIVLPALGLTGAFETEATGDEVARGKPAPDIYQLAATRLNIAPEHCLALEDAPLGVAAAKAAGMTCLAVPNEMTAALDGFQIADAVLPSLDAVLSWLDERS